MEYSLMGGELKKKPFEITDVNVSFLETNPSRVYVSHFSKGISVAPTIKCYGDVAGVADDIDLDPSDPDIPLMINGRWCTPESIWAFLTALAIWLQAQYDNKASLDGCTLHRVMVDFATEYLQPK